MADPDAPSSAGGAFSYTNILWGIDVLGFYGGYLVLLIVAAALSNLGNRGMYIVVLFLGFLGGQWINKALKMVFRDPRPKNPVPMVLPVWDMAHLRWVLEHDGDMYKGAEAFGFPSGHAQGVAYSVFFLYFVLGKITRLWLVCAAIGCITLIQRWKYRRHTVEQLVAGVAVGAVLAMGTARFLGTTEGGPRL